VSLTVFVIRRLVATVLLVPGVMLVTFALLRGARGNPFEPPEGYPLLPAPTQHALEEYYHLDEPWFVEFAVYLKNVFTLNFGPSQVQRDLDVNAVMRESLPVTLELVLLAVACAVPLGIGLGVLAATKRSTAIDFAAVSAASILLVLPVFFVAFVLSEYLVFEWQLFPSGWEGWKAKVLPALTLALAPTGYIARLVRAAVVEQLQEDYVRTARAKGLEWERIVWVHILRNSLGPFVSAAAPMLALLVTGAFFVEQLFRVPGVSSFFVEGARTRDYSLLLGLTVALAVIVLVANLIADVVLAAVDPRAREAKR
jgi:ABC-type dipeptide/oligopeptide/nickel transport system permease component